MKKARKACAFTGHRPKKLPWGYNEADVRCVALKAALERQIRSLVQEEIVLNLRAEYPCIKLHCILPYKGQEAEWSAASQARYHTIMAQADSIIYVSRMFRKNCMLERNHFLAVHSDVLLAVYNGEYRGGTAATIRYAQKLGRSVIVLDPKQMN